MNFPPTLALAAERKTMALTSDMASLPRFDMRRLATVSCNHCQEVLAGARGTAYHRVEDQQLSDTCSQKRHQETFALGSKRSETHLKYPTRGYERLRSLVCLPGEPWCWLEKQGGDIAASRKSRANRGTAQKFQFRHQEISSLWGATSRSFGIMRSGDPPSVRCELCL